MNLNGTKTEKNLLASFAGESQARNRYTFFAKVAKKEGYEKISEIFLETADNEHQHAKEFFKYLEGGMVEITAMYPAGVIGTTHENLEAAAKGEHEEWEVLYPEAAKVATEEGFEDIAKTFELVARVEKEHEERYKKLAESVEKGEVFKRNEKTAWKCRKCGHIHYGEEALDTCPVCKHPQAYFEERAVNY